MGSPPQGMTGENQLEQRQQTSTNSLSSSMADPIPASSTKQLDTGSTVSSNTSATAATTTTDVSDEQQSLKKEVLEKGDSAEAAATVEEEAAGTASSADRPVNRSTHILSKKESCRSDPGVPLGRDDGQLISISDSEQPVERKLTAYERVTVELDTDENVRQEVVLGKRVGMYRMRGTLGSGNFSQVKLASHVLTREYVAIKILDKTKLDEKTQRLLSREISNMERLHHPNIIRIYEVLETLSKVHIVMEYALGGELYSKVTSERRLPEPIAQFVFAQITAAMQHMHSRNIIHRDLKAENVMFAGSSQVSAKEDDVHRKLHVKIGDFGFSTYAKPDDKLTTFCGSPPYAAPELFQDDWYFGPPVDIWAMGVLLCFMLSAQMPFRAETIGKLKRLILGGHYSLPNWLSPAVKELIRSILKVNVAERLDIEAIRNHSWLSGQRFPDPIQPYQMTPKTGTATVPEEDDTVADLDAETEAVRLIQEYGITEEHMESAQDQASRSQVTGVYRIMLHRVHRNRRPSHMVTNGLPHSLSDPELARRAPAAAKGKKTASGGSAGSGGNPTGKMSKVCSLL